MRSNFRPFWILRARRSAFFLSTLRSASSIRPTDVAHAENARGDPIRMECFQGVGLLPDAEELDRLARHRAYRQRRPAPGIAVGLGKHYAGQRQRFVERLGRYRGILAGHRIDHEESLHRIESPVNRRHFRHHFLVDGEPAGRVDDQHIVKALLGVRKRTLRDCNGFLVRAARDKPGTGFCGQSLQLVDGSRTVDIGAHHCHAFALPLLQVARKLGHRGGLARALQTG